jgi:hypothetical protein
MPCRLALEVHVNGQRVNGAGEARASEEETGAHRYQSSSSSPAAKCTRVVTAEGREVIGPGYSTCRRRARNKVVSYLEKGSEVSNMHDGKQVAYQESNPRVGGKFTRGAGVTTNSGTNSERLRHHPMANMVEGALGKVAVTPTFYKNKIFVQIGMHIKMHIKY